MKKILITGISGTGKSTLIETLAALGYKAIDGDTPEWCHWIEITDPTDQYGSTVEPTRDWVWREDRISALLSTEDAPILFLSSCPSNMGQFLPRFTDVILLTAPAPTLADRLATRTNNDYGKQPHELERILEQKQIVEPLLRRIATHELAATSPPDQLASTILQLISTTPK